MGPRFRGDDGGASAMTDLVTEEITVPSEPGIEIFVRNKRPADLATFSPERTLLFVHGSTYPAHAGFDVPLGGQSWMESIASCGYDVYCLDVRGYGRSTRPKPMSEPAANNPPVTRTPDAVKDITAVLKAVLKRRNIPRLNLLGWSWGCTLMSDHRHTESGQGRAPDAARAVVDPHPAAAVQRRGPGRGAYRLDSKAAASERWLNGVPEGKQAALIPAGWFEQWADAMWATDPDGAKHNPPVVRAPNGTVADTCEYWKYGKALYDPAKITVPTLIAVGEWDRDTPPVHGAGDLPAAGQVARRAAGHAGRRHAHRMPEKNRRELRRRCRLLDEVDYS